MNRNRDSLNWILFGVKHPMGKPERASRTKLNGTHPLVAVSRRFLPNPFIVLLDKRNVFLSWGRPYELTKENACNKYLKPASIPLVKTRGLTLSMIIFPPLFHNHLVAGVTVPASPTTCERCFALVPCIMATGAGLVGPCVVLGQSHGLDDFQNGHGLFFHDANSPSTTRLVNNVYSGLKPSVTSPTGPLRCFAIIKSVCPFRSEAGLCNSSQYRNITTSLSCSICPDSLKSESCGTLAARLSTSRLSYL